MSSHRLSVKAIKEKYIRGWPRDRDVFGLAFAHLTFSRFDADKNVTTESMTKEFWSRYWLDLWNHVQSAR
jgi:hypothetical protein